MTRHPLLKYRALKPVILFGRVVGTNEIVFLPDVDGEVLVKSGHLFCVDADAPNRGSSWDAPILTR